MDNDLGSWRGCATPKGIVMEGRYVILEPLRAKKHTDELYEASGEGRTRYMWEDPGTREQFYEWMVRVESSNERVFFAVVDKISGKVGGRQCLMRINAEHGVVELGSILRGPLIARKPAATEAIFLFLKHLFDELGYRRVEWKCHNSNGDSKKAALRFGFTYEGLFRQHYVMKGENRDTAWYSIIDREWPLLKLGYEMWLNPANFDENGCQIKRLEDCIQLQNQA